MGGKCRVEPSPTNQGPSRDKPSGLRVAQRTDALLSALRHERSAATIARRCGISARTLYRFDEQLLEGS